MRDGFVFYRSFMFMINTVKKSRRWLLFSAIAEYALDGVVPQLPEEEMNVFRALCPQIDANNRRYENGKKGGRPPKTVGESASISETKPKPKEKEQEQVKEKEKVQVQEQVQAKEQAHGLVRAEPDNVLDLFIARKCKELGIEGLGDIGQR